MNESPGYDVKLFIAECLSSELSFETVSPTDLFSSLICHTRQNNTCKVCMYV